MHHQRHTSRNSIGNDFFAHGIQGIETHRVAERRDAERFPGQIQPNRTSLVRRFVGTVMIAIGTGIAGTHIPTPGERAVSPHPSARDGLATTR